MVKIAIIGAGYMAKEHIRAFKDIEGVEVSGIYSRTTAKAQELALEFGIHKIAKSVQELYDKTQADLVVITASVLSIAEVSVECFRFPWICLIEKPPGYNLEEAIYVQSQSAQHKARAYVALNRRHFSSTRTVLDQLNEQNFSRVVKVCDQEDMNDPHRIGHPQKIIDNWMYANSIHMVDYFSMFCRGNVTSVNRVVRWNPVDPRYVVAQLTFDSGDIGLYEAIWNAPSPWAVSIITPKARWDMSPLEFATRQDYGSRNKKQIDLDGLDDQYKPGLRVQAELAVRAVRDPSVILPTLDDAIHTMGMIKLIYN